MKPSLVVAFITFDRLSIEKRRQRLVDMRMHVR